MSNRWTFNANTNGIDEAAYSLALDKWKPSAQLLMNGLKGKSDQNVAVRLSRRTRYTIYRPFEGDIEGKHWRERSVDNHLKFLLDHDAPENVWFQVGNEPRPTSEGEIKSMCAWYAKLIRKSAAAGVPLVVYNPPVGGFEKRDIEKGWYDELLVALLDHAHVMRDGWPMYILGSHSSAYWMGIAALNTAGRHPIELTIPDAVQRKNWPTQEQIFDADTSNNWILFRDWWFVERARAILSKEAAHNISIIATEAGPENLPNYRKDFSDVTRFIDEKCGQEWRGAPTTRGYYEWAFPSQPWSRSLADDFQFVDRNAPEEYLAFCWFSWTTHNDAPDFWADKYGAHKMSEVIDALVVKVAEPQGAVPKPENLSVGRAAELTHKSAVNLRTGPGTQYTILKAFSPGAVLTVYPGQVATTGGGFEWFWVENEADKGWMALVGGNTFEAQFKKIEPPKPTIELDRELVLQTVAALRFAADSLEALLGTD